MHVQTNVTHQNNDF